MLGGGRLRESQEGHKLRGRKTHVTECAVTEPTEATPDLTPLIKNAQRGLRRDVQALLDRLPQGELFIPLAKNISGAADGERLEIGDGEVKLVPHMLLDEDGNHY